MDLLVLIQNIKKENLFIETIYQINKDFKLANIDKNISHLIEPKELGKELYTILSDLFINNYDEYLNLLYRIDVQENDLKKLNYNKLTDAIKEISFLILKREFQKVWFKKNIQIKLFMK